MKYVKRKTYLDSYREAHSYNEAIAYNVVPYLLGILGVLILGFLYLGSKLEGKK